MTNEEYLEKYEEKYGKLDEEGKKHVLKYRNSLNEEELEKDINEWINLDDKKIVSLLLIRR
jgi:hypothetical protein